MQKIKKAQKKRSDVANFAMRIFLQRVGESYDTMRGYEVFKPSHKQWEVVIEFFGGKCCYCNTFLTPENNTQDHLIPQNKQYQGLHAWGNVVACCGQCNKKKQHRVWTTYLEEICTQSECKIRRAKIESFVRKYTYKPHLELKEIAANLYEDVGAVVMTLIDLRFKQARQVIANLHSKEGDVIKSEHTSVVIIDRSK